MSKKTIKINLLPNGKYEIVNENKTENAILTRGEANSVLFSVLFPEFTKDKNFEYEAVLGGGTKKFIGEKIDERVNFTLSEINEETINVGFCALLRNEDDSVAKYVKWQGVQYNVINGGNNYGG